MRLLENGDIVLESAEDFRYEEELCEADRESREEYFRYLKECKREGGDELVLHKSTCQEMMIIRESGGKVQTYYTIPVCYEMNDWCAEFHPELWHQKDIVKWGDDGHVSKTYTDVSFSFIL